MNSETVGMGVFIIGFIVVIFVLCVLLFAAREALLSSDDLERSKYRYDLPDTKFNLTPEQRANFEKRFIKGMEDANKRMRGW